VSALWSCDGTGPEAFAFYKGLRFIGNRWCPSSRESGRERIDSVYPGKIAGCDTTKTGSRRLSPLNTAITRLFAPALPDNGGGFGGVLVN